MPTPSAAHPPVDLLAGLRPPLELALARAGDTIPAPQALAGGAQYEPKWDGFRIAIVRDGDRTSLWSRQGKDLTGSFPDLAEAAAQQVPPGFVVDGEAVVWANGRLDFDSLQRRLITRGAALTHLVRARPAVFVGFDLLAAAGRDVRGHPLRTRRTLLEALADDWAGPLQLTPATTDRDQAGEWFAALPATNIEGLVVKGRDELYTGGQRIWTKVKHRDTIDVTCAAITGTLTRPEELLIGLPTDDTLQILGRSTPLSAAAARSLAPYLHTPAGPHPWPSTLPATAGNRFARDRSPVPVVLIEPIVIEISADVARTGRIYRHLVRYLRPRPELTPADLQPLSRAG